MNRSAQAISVPKDFKNAWNAKRYRAGSPNAGSRAIGLNPGASA